MFTKKKVQFGSEIAKNLIEANTEIEGNIFFSSSIQIRGKILGDIKAKEHPAPESKAKLADTIHVCQGGLVEGNLHATSILVDGTVYGNIFSSEELKLGETARVKGTINYKKISIHTGAKVSGSFHAEATLQSIPIIRDEKPSDKKTTPKTTK